MINSLASSSAKKRLTADFHADIRWWHSFLRNFNGKCPFLSEKPITDVHTDACQLAAGAFFFAETGFTIILEWIAHI